MIILLLKVVLQVLACGLAILPSTLDYVFHDKRRRSFKRLRILLFMVAFLFLVAAVAVTIADDISRRAEITFLKLELSRNLQRIEDVGFAFHVYVPMDHPDLAKYTSRITPLIEEYYSQRLSHAERNWGSVSVPFISDSHWFPRLNGERAAYAFLSHVCMQLHIFADPNAAEALVPTAGHGGGAGGEDLRFLLTRTASNTEANDVSLAFDVARRRFELWSSDARTGPSQRSSGRIMSVPDLAGAAAVLHFCPIACRNENERQRFLALGKDRHLSFFALTFSGGQKLNLRPERHMNNYGEWVYLLKFPKTVEEMEKVIGGKAQDRG